MHKLVIGLLGVIFILLLATLLLVIVSVFTGNALSAEVATRWHPWYLKKGNISREQFITAIEKGDMNVLRVRPKYYQLQLANLGLPIGPENQDLVVFLRSSRVKVIRCTSKLLRQYNMSRTNTAGTKFDFGWQRKSCYKGEQFLVFLNADGKKIPFLSLGCGNILKPVKKMRVAGVCPQGRTLIVAVYDLKTLPSVLLKKARQLTGREQSVTGPSQKAFFTNAFSRTLGRELWYGVKKKQFSRVVHPVRVKLSFVKMDALHRVTKERSIKLLTTGTDGLARYHFGPGEIEGRDLRLVFPIKGIVSPPLAYTGKREGRAFWSEWGNDCVTVFSAAVSSP